MLLSPRYLPRLSATVGLFTRYGLKDFATRQGIEGLAAEEAEELSSGNGDGVIERARGFRKRLVELGPAYIKLGQILSTRPDLVPEAYIRELEHLQDDVSPLPYSVVEETIEAELGARISKLFKDFNPEPLGSASLGQVHEATLRDGRAVVVKAQRPGIRETLADDIEFFREFARFLADHTRAGQRIDLVGIIQQLEMALLDELDYRVEARNAAAFRRALAGFPRLLIPRVIEAYSSEKVLTTERIRGIKIDDIPKVSRVEHDFAALAEEFAKAYLKQITIDGHFHADPHPGNVFVVMPGTTNPWTPAEVVAGDRRADERPALTPLSKVELDARKEAAQEVGTLPSPDEPKLAMIDFGMTARLSTTMRDQIVRLLLDIAENKGDDAAETLIEIGQVGERFVRQEFVAAVASMVGRNYDLSIGEIEAGTLLYEMLNLSFAHGLKLPAELTLLAKALFNLDAVTRALDPTFSPIETIREFSARIANDRAKRELSLSRVFQMATQTSDLITALPHRLDLLTQKLAANEFAIQLEAPQVHVLLRGMQKIANRVFSGVVLAGIVVASAMLLPHRRVLGTTGFIMAALIGLYMVVSILVQDRSERRK
ncbi:MAG TPA: AarF/UbiB family protein [Gemmatimonadaceae bacterium]|nr:AarF/UbiB family protein [Gemmatimonadaceae bacterium]